MSHILQRFFYILTLILIFRFIDVKSQDIRSNSFYYPHSLKTYEILHTLGFSTASLPEEVVEESDDAIRAPLLYYKIKMGLPENFNVVASYKTNYVTHHLTFGPKWVYEFGKFNMSVGADAAFYYGRMKSLDFDSEIKGWSLYPNLTLGYLFPNFSVSLKSELMLMANQSAFTANIEVDDSYKTFSGFSFSTYMEQPLFKDNYFVIGFRANYARFYYPMWIAFSTFDRFFFIPEVMFSFNL